MNCSPEGVAVNCYAEGHRTRECRVVTLLHLCMSRLYKVSHGEAGNELGKTLNCRKVSSQEVNNNSKQSSNKRGPSKVLTLKHIMYPYIKSIPVGICRHMKRYKKVAYVRVEMESIFCGTVCLFGIY